MAKTASIAICALLLVYFLFTSGLVFEESHSNAVGTIDLPYSLALSGQRLNMVGIFNEDDVACVRWLVDNRADVPLKVDYNVGALLMGCQHKVSQYFAPSKNDIGYYLFLSSWNVENQMMVVGASPALRRYVPLPELDKATVVFSKGDAIIYYVVRE